MTCALGIALNGATGELAHPQMDAAKIEVAMAKSARVFIGHGLARFAGGCRTLASTIAKPATDLSGGVAHCLRSRSWRVHNHYWRTSLSMSQTTGGSPMKRLSSLLMGSHRRLTPIVMELKALTSFGPPLRFATY